MKTTTYPLEDHRGIAALCIELFHAAMSPPVPKPAAPARPGAFTRVGRWLATSTDVFELESRLREAGRQPYFF